MSLGQIYSTFVGRGGNDFFHAGDFQGDDDLVAYTASSVPIRVDGAANTVRQGSTTDRLAPGVYVTIRGSRYADRMAGSDGKDSEPHPRETWTCGRQSSHKSKLTSRTDLARYDGGMSCVRSDAWWPA